MAKATDLDADISLLQLYTEDWGLIPGPAKSRVWPAHVGEA